LRRRRRMVKWSGGYDPPNDPDLITRARWWLEDAWRRLDSVDKHSILIMFLALALAVVIRVFGG